ncbi:hypothetical protein [Leifsonia soli]|uniref:Glycosyltransferase RgtA/B/C/D-like domain-containing protein n=1 Tax=Leifsonia soli TaxID=582665 RepID=A0A852SVQ2_9MICO|nr:hypothetical protein [Leifsonia soli]NYD72630.1 hypothetical protein [Leifsonia soli]
MRRLRLPSAAIWATAGVEVVLVVLGGATGVQWPFFLVSALLVLLALGQFLGWALALATEIIGAFAVLALLMPLYPVAHLGLEWSNIVVCAVLASGALAVISKRKGALRVPGRSATWLFAATMVVPALGVAATVFSIVAYGGGHVSWVMGNDSVWNTVAARLFVTDGGLVASVHPNPSPFSNELMASAMAPGRGRLAPSDLLGHDILRIIQLWLFLTFLASALSSLVVAREIAPERRWARAIAAVAAGVIPLLWYVSGFSYSYGFVNVTVSLVVMLCIWIVWRESGRRPLVGVSSLLLATTLMLAVWAPLAPIPALLVVTAAVAGWRDWRVAVRWPGALLIGLAVLQLLAYVLLVTLPDLRRDGQALGGGGAMVPIGPASLVIAGIVTFTLASIGAAGRRQRRTFAGVCVIIVAGGAAVAWLSHQAAARGGWGYYSAKLTWQLTILALVIAAALIVGWLNVAGKRIIESTAIFVAAGAIVTFVAGQVPPSVWSARQVLPALSIGRVGGISANDQEAAVLFAISDPGKKSLAVQYYTDPLRDLFINGWLIQEHSDLSADPMRDNAYFLDTSKIDQVCSVVNQWGGHVDVYTRNPQLQDELATQCPDADITVRTGEVGTSSR